MPKAVFPIESMLIRGTDRRCSRRSYYDVGWIVPRKSRSECRYVFVFVEEVRERFEIEAHFDFVRSSFLERVRGVILAWLMKSPSWRGLRLIMSREIYREGREDKRRQIEKEGK